MSCGIPTSVDSAEAVTAVRQLVTKFTICLMFVECAVGDNNNEVKHAGGMITY